MLTTHELRPGEARTLDFLSGIRYLVHRPGQRPVYLVFEEDRVRRTVAPVGTFSTWGAAMGAVRARSLPYAVAG
jgi:hypothetical protein